MITNLLCRFLQLTMAELTWKFNKPRDLQNSRRRDVLECLKLSALHLVIFSYLLFQPFQTCSRGQLGLVFANTTSIVCRDLYLFAWEKKNLFSHYNNTLHSGQFLFFYSVLHRTFDRFGCDLFMSDWMASNTFLKGVYPAVICSGHPFLFYEILVCKCYRGSYLCEFWSIKRKIYRGLDNTK